LPLTSANRGTRRKTGADMGRLEMPNGCSSDLRQISTHSSFHPPVSRLGHGIGSWNRGFAPAAAGGLDDFRRDPAPDQQVFYEAGAPQGKCICLWIDEKESCTHHAITRRITDSSVHNCPLSVADPAVQAFAAFCASVPALARSRTVIALATKLAASARFDGMISVLPALASSLNAPT